MEPAVPPLARETHKPPELGGTGPHLAPQARPHAPTRLPARPAGGPGGLCRPLTPVPVPAPAPRSAHQDRPRPWPAPAPAPSPLLRPPWWRTSPPSPKERPRCPTPQATEAPGGPVPAAREWLGPAAGEAHPAGASGPPRLGSGPRRRHRQPPPARPGPARGTAGGPGLTCRLRGPPAGRRRPEAARICRAVPLRPRRGGRAGPGPGPGPGRRPGRGLAPQRGLGLRPGPPRGLTPAGAVAPGEVGQGAGAVRGTGRSPAGDGDEGRGAAGLPASASVAMGAHRSPTGSQCPTLSKH